MKKHLLFLGLFLISFVSAFSQMQQPLPVDPKVKHGQLSNGLTYYIRHNELPKERADFYIAQKVGSMQEEENQRGLAHFLEHMAFNGSEHFPENGIIKYLETIGVKFGVNLNAYTAFDQTVYNISDVPVTKEGAIDSCLLILHDWSNSLSLESDDIDKERGVIREEMRSRNHASFRQIEKLLPVIMPDSKYAQRMPIGTEEVVMNFKPEELRDYYHKWYRPDLQAIIIVGDFDAEQMESKLKATFADIPAPVNPAERVYYNVEENSEPLVGVVTDKESTRTIVEIDFKHKPLPREAKATAHGLVMNYLNSIANRIFSERFSDLTQKANPPFVGANSSNGDFLVANTEESWSSSAMVKDNDVETALKTLTRELMRVKKYGFTESEYDRAKSNYLTWMENMFNERDKTKNRSYADEYVEHFLNGGYIPGIEIEYNTTKLVAEQIPLHVINQYIEQLIGDKNITIFLMAPEKEDIIVPAKEQLLVWFNEARNEDVKAPEEKTSNEPLLSELPNGGKIVSETTDKIFDATVFTLSNGVKVAVKSTKLKSDEILMGATSPGGSSLFPESEMVNIQLYSNISSIGGLGKFSQTELSKVLAGKKVQVRTTIGLTSEGFNGSSSVKDFETMLQLIYLNFTAPRSDEEVYQSTIARIKSQLENIEADPEITLQDTLLKYLYVDQNRHFRLKAKDLDKVNYQTIEKWRKDRYADASDFTFVFTGNIDLETAKPLIEKYLGSLPSIQRKETSANVNENYRPGFLKSAFDQKVQNPKANVIDIYWTTFDYTLKNLIEADMLKQILNIVYTEKIREEEGGTYGVSVSAGISEYPKGQSMLQIYFETEPSKSEYLNKLVRQILQDMAKEGPREVDFNKVKEYMLKKQQENEQENSYWRSVMMDYYRRDFNSYTDYVKTLNEVSQADIQKKLQTILDANNALEVIMTGIKED
ncbi:MAG: insulinase family protein [Dysgonamonadaceae bacterium]|jgi:zinc protease|nr:insulinase family protein [Dysgonamonadaceae bacterium]